MFFRCAAHGRLPWLGHGVCEACDRRIKHLLREKDICSCGVRLLPYGKHIVEKLFAAALTLDNSAFTGRPCCAKCFEEMGRGGVSVVEGGEEGSAMFED